ncbi:MAG: hypothetical protein M1402_00085 [Candidatus Thermoplasmatota archaeon]|nr:hypothetical protein [Candidatus Thermoplasmatota archaeon]MCL5665442.1 hypothetical protein [Candidatus Thermoplasmatota archaeon]
MADPEKTTGVQESVLQWLQTPGNGKRLIDLEWSVKKAGNLYIIQNEKVPFTILLTFGDRTLNLIVDTGVETAILENQKRLTIYRSLLILNRQVELVKFMLDGMNENVFARVDMEIAGMTRDVLDEALNVLLSALYIMVKALNLEDQFNQMVVDRMVDTINTMTSEGKSRDDIVKYLVEHVGFPQKDAERVVDEILQKGSSDTEDLYR